MKKKIIALVASLALVASVGAGATLAYLTDTTDVVTNTFTVGKVDITLSENSTASEGVKAGVAMYVNNKFLGYEYDRLLPGDVLSKNVDVTVEDGSEKCYVFVKVTGASENYTYSVNEAWTPVTGATNVYYQVAEYSTEDRVLDVMDTVTVNTTTEQDSAALTITVKAAAVQFDNVKDVAAAYAMISSELQ